MEASTTFVLVVGSAAVTGLLAGASLDQSVKQLPARFTIGHVAYSKYSRAADLGYGIALYSILGVGAAVLAIAAAWSAHHDGAPSAAATPLYIGAAVAVFHSICTTQAAPTISGQRRFADDEDALRRIFAKFQRWQTLRCGLQLLGFGVALWGVVVYVAIH
jgi:hypothetical protein